MYIVPTLSSFPSQPQKGSQTLIGQRGRGRQGCIKQSGRPSRDGAQRPHTAQCPCLSQSFAQLSRPRNSLSASILKDHLEIKFFSEISRLSHTCEGKVYLEAAPVKQNACPALRLCQAPAPMTSCPQVLIFIQLGINAASGPFIPHLGTVHGSSAIQ